MKRVRHNRSRSFAACKLAKAAPGRRVTALRQGRLVWSVTYIDGNLTYLAPTIYPASMTHAEVIADIRRRSPDLEVAL